MIGLAHVGDVLAMHARLFPDKIGARDLGRAMTFRQWDARACRLANALIGWLRWGFEAWSQGGYWRKRAPTTVPPELPAATNGNGEPHD